MSELVPPADLREQMGVVLSRIAPNLQEADLDAVLEVWAERERQIVEQRAVIEADAFYRGKKSGEAERESVLRSRTEALRKNHGPQKMGGGVHSYWGAAR